MCRFHSYDCYIRCSANLIHYIRPHFSDCWPRSIAFLAVSHFNIQSDELPRSRKFASSNFSTSNTIRPQNCIEIRWLLKFEYLLPRFKALKSECAWRRFSDGPTLVMSDLGDEEIAYSYEIQYCLQRSSWASDDVVVNTATMVRSNVIALTFWNPTESAVSSIQRIVWLQCGTASRFKNAHISERPSENESMLSVNEGVILQRKQT